MNKKVFVAVGTLSLLLFNCGMDIANGGVENGNPVLTGYVHDERGTAARNTIIKLIPYDNNPRLDNSIAATVLSDEKGMYRFDTVDNGTYNIVGETSDGSMSFIDSITVEEDSSITANYIVKSPGYFKGVVKLQPYRQGMVLIVLLGTNTYTMTVDTIGNYSSPKLPEGAYRAVIISTLPEFSDTQITINVESGETTTVDTIALAYIGVTFDSVALQQYKKTCNEKLPGTYTGTVTTSWEPAHNVAFVIDSSGHYSAYTTITSELSALYYGSDMEDSRKKIVLTQINANGGISGSIHIVVNAASVVEDEIRELRFNSLFDTLTFELWHSASGRVQISLHRIPSDSLPPRPPRWVFRPEISIVAFMDTMSLRGPDPRTYLDSIRITITHHEDTLPVIYQIINCAVDNLSADSFWRDDLPYQTYKGPFIYRQKGINQSILGRVKSDDVLGAVTGLSFNLE